MKKMNIEVPTIFVYDCQTYFKLVFGKDMADVLYVDEYGEPTFTINNARFIVNETDCIIMGATNLKQYVFENRSHEQRTGLFTKEIVTIPEAVTKETDENRVVTRVFPKDKCVLVDLEGNLTKQVI